MEGRGEVGEGAKNDTFLSNYTSFFLAEDIFRAKTLFVYSGNDDVKTGLIRLTIPFLDTNGSL